MEEIITTPRWKYGRMKREIVKLPLIVRQLMMEEIMLLKGGGNNRTGYTVPFRDILTGVTVKVFVNRTGRSSKIMKTL
jgi:hypothetical protein